MPRQRPLFRKALRVATTQQDLDAWFMECVSTKHHQDSLFAVLSGSKSAGGFRRRCEVDAVRIWRRGKPALTVHPVERLSLLLVMTSELELPDPDAYDPDDLDAAYDRLTEPEE